MSSSWYPDVEQLRRDAKRLLRAAQQGESAALARFARSDRAPVLADAQHAVAVSVGFPSWAALVAAAQSPAKDKAQLTRLVLYRPQDDNDGRFRCHTRAGLTVEGRAAVERLGAWLATPSSVQSFYGDLVPAPSRVVAVSSAMPPSMEAAEILAAATSSALEPGLCDLCDAHPGAAEGLTPAERMARFGPNSSFVPGAETWDVVRARVAAAIETLTRRYQGSTIVVAAGSQVVMTSMVALGGMSAEDVGLVSRGGDKGSVTEWARLDGGDVRRAGRWGLWRFNATV